MEGIVLPEFDHYPEIVLPEFDHDPEGEGYLNGKIGILSESYHARRDESELQLFIVDMDLDINNPPVPMIPFLRLIFEWRPSHAVCILRNKVYFFDGRQFEGQQRGQFQHAGTSRRINLQNLENPPDGNYIRIRELQWVWFWLNDHDLFKVIAAMHFAKPDPIALPMSRSEIIVFSSDVSMDTDLDVRAGGVSVSFELYNERSNSWTTFPVMPHRGCICGERVGDRQCSCYRVIAHCGREDHLWIKTGNGSFTLNIRARHWYPFDAIIHKSVRGCFADAEGYFITSDGRQCFLTNMIQFRQISLSIFGPHLMRSQNHIAVQRLHPSITHNNRGGMFCLAGFLQGRTGHLGRYGRVVHLLLDEVLVGIHPIDDIILLKSISTCIQFLGDELTLRLVAFPY